MALFHEDGCSDARGAEGHLPVRGVASAARDFREVPVGADFIEGSPEVDPPRFRGKEPVLRCRALEPLAAVVAEDDG